MKRIPTFPRQSGFFDENLSIRDFQKIRILGKGSFGQVILFKHRVSGVEYAIKKIALNKNEKISRQELESMTKKEIEILYKLNSQHIIKLLDHFEDENAVYLITEFVEGINLYETTQKRERLPLQEIADIIYQCCCGLEELHSHHILHRDIKLENIMYNNSLIKLVDLGCSNFFGRTIERKTMIGTHLYYSPEILLEEEQNNKLDVWCLGVVLYQLVFRCPPFNDPNIDKKIRKIQYTFPEKTPIDAQLKDLFKNIFTSKNNRLSASDIKRHPWIIKHCKHREPKHIKFEDFFTEFEVQNYRQLLEDYIKSEEESMLQLKSQSAMLEGMLKEANRELRDLRSKKQK